jgi:hypothetical protein
MRLRRGHRVNLYLAFRNRYPLLSWGLERLGLLKTRDEREDLVHPVVIRALENTSSEALLIAADRARAHSNFRTTLWDAEGHAVSVSYASILAELLLRQQQEEELLD